MSIFQRSFASDEYVVDTLLVRAALVDGDLTVSSFEKEVPPAVSAPIIA